MQKLKVRSVNNIVKITSKINVYTGECTLELEKFNEDVIFKVDIGKYEKRGSLLMLGEAHGLTCIIKQDITHCHGSITDVIWQNVCSIILCTEWTAVSYIKIWRNIKLYYLMIRNRNNNEYRTNITKTYYFNMNIELI